VTAADEELGPDDITKEVVVPANVRSIPSKVALQVVEGPRTGEILVIERDHAVLGRGSEADLRIPDASLSRMHARFDRAGDTLSVTDLGSRNGTQVQGRMIEERTQLEVGDLVTVGRVVLRFSVQDAREVAASRELYEAAVRDRLTGLHNRGYFDDRLASEFAFARRHGSALALLLLDIDHFKRVNDQYGHPAGDAVLKAVSHRVTETLRKEDVGARFGGEEFAVLVRNDEAGAQVLAQRLRTRIGATEVDVGDTRIRVTVSIGLAVMRKEVPYDSGASLVAAADEALYAAKRNGRDQVVLNVDPRRPTEKLDGSYSYKGDAQGERIESLGPKKK